jgi:hypothetical protein
MPEVRARDSGVFPKESVRLKFTGTDFALGSFESEMKQESVSCNKHRKFIVHRSPGKPSKQTKQMKHITTADINMGAY